MTKSRSRIETMKNERAKPKGEQGPIPNNASTHPNFSSPQTRLVAAQYYYCCALFLFLPSKPSASALLHQLPSIPSVLNRIFSQADSIKRSISHSFLNFNRSASVAYCFFPSITWRFATVQLFLYPVPGLCAPPFNHDSEALPLMPLCISVLFHSTLRGRRL